jgi:hypothetical protein
MTMLHSKMGADTNVQKRWLPCITPRRPWGPGDIEQREGRILRQGKENPKVHIHRYVTVKEHKPLKAPDGRNTNRYCDVQHRLIIARF